MNVLEYVGCIHSSINMNSETKGNEMEGNKVKNTIFIILKDVNMEYAACAFTIKGIYVHVCQTEEIAKNKVEKFNSNSKKNENFYYISYEIESFIS